MPSPDCEAQLLAGSQWGKRDLGKRGISRKPSSHSISCLSRIRQTWSRFRFATEAGVGYMPRNSPESAPVPRQRTTHQSSQEARQNKGECQKAGQVPTEQPQQRPGKSVKRKTSRAICLFVNQASARTKQPTKSDPLLSS